MYRGMYRRKKRTLTVLLFLILFISIGYSLLSANLSIQGVSDISASKWDIHWDAASFQQTSGSVDILGPTRQAGTNPTFTDTNINFGVKLDKPGEFAEFTIDVVNEGTVNAKLTSITMTPLTTTQQKYLKYTVTYGGASYDSTTTGLNISLPCSSNNAKTVKVKVSYLYPETATDLPSTDQEASFYAYFAYEQAS